MRLEYMAVEQQPVLLSRLLYPAGLAVSLFVDTSLNGMDCVTAAFGSGFFFWGEMVVEVKMPCFK